jgi:energy-coupling factor transporter ATP-binding protein EcfA2
MYGNPSIIVLDEPNSNLDDVGEAALLQGIMDLRQHHKTIVLITHRTSIIGATTKLLLFRDGVAAMFAVPGIAPRVWRRQAGGRGSGCARDRACRRQGTQTAVSRFPKRFDGTSTARCKAHDSAITIASTTQTATGNTTPA